MHTISVNLGDRSYPIHVGFGIMSVLKDVLKDLGAQGTVGVVTDSNVNEIYGQTVRENLVELGLTPVVHVMPAGEEHKRLQRVEDICETFLEARLDRSSVIVALGGGVVGDVGGFAAACYMRGLRFVQVPTTIVAQVDSSVGGKTGVNHPLGKNTIGAFHQPSAVIIDIECLSTLPGRELRAGLAEVIKHGVIADEELFVYMERHTEQILQRDLSSLEFPIVRSCEIKSKVVAEDEREAGRRAILNYGHTFGHAIEAVTGYKTYLHGEAIALGMTAAAALARDLGMVDDAFVERQEACFRACELPVRWPDLPVGETLEAMAHDKKARAGTMMFVLADRLGHVVQRTDVTQEQARAALEAIRRERD